MKKILLSIIFCTLLIPQVSMAADGDPLLSPGNTLTVAMIGAEYTTITLALVAASAGDTILVYPGTYDESLTVPVNNISIVGMGTPLNTTISQVDANVIDFGATTGGRIQNFSILLSAPTTAICAITGSTGNFQVTMCKTTVTCTQNLSQVDQPTIGCLTGAGKLSFILGQAIYDHSGATVTGVKSPFKVVEGGVIQLYNMKNIDINGSGSSNITATAISAGTGYFQISNCNIDVDDDTSTTTVGFGYIGSATSTEDEFVGNVLHVHGDTNNVYGALAFLGSLRSAQNYIHVEVSDHAGGGRAYSFVESGDGVVNSHMDDIVAEDGYTGNINMVSSASDGELTVTGNAKAATYGSDGTVTDAELLYINSLSSNAQTQIDGKQATPTVYAKTSSATLTGTEVSGLNTIHNDGAGGEVVLTWLTRVTGQEAVFYVNDAQHLQIKADSGGKIRIGPVQTAVDGYIRSNVVGSWIRIKAMPDELVVMGYGGIWTYDE